MNRIQSKENRIRTYEINKISLSCFDEKIYIHNNGYDGLVLGYQSKLYSYLNNYSQKLSCQANRFNFQSIQNRLFANL